MFPRQILVLENPTAVRAYEPVAHKQLAIGQRGRHVEQIDAGAAIDGDDGR